MTRSLIQVWALATIALSPAGCVYSEEVSWRECCLLFVVTDEPSVPPAQNPTVDWQARTLFSGDGQASDLRLMGNDSLKRGRTRSLKEERIKAAITEFFVGHPGARAHDYFLSLGMACTPTLWAPLVEATRCEIELPIWIRCHSSDRYEVPPPKELRGPIPGFLRMTVDVSAITVLDFHARIDPVPGGRLCHR